MDKHEELYKQYIQQKSELDQQEEELMIQGKKAFEVLTDVQDRSFYYIRQNTNDEELIRKGYWYIEQINEEIDTKVKEERKILQKKQWQLEELYNEQLRKLDDKE